MSHPIVHIELSAHDHAAAGEWYQKLFGWELQSFPGMNYTTFTSGEGAPGGGFSPVQEGNKPGMTVIYISTDDINATLAKVVEAGGTKTLDPMEVPGVGQIAWFDDPTGNHMALLQPAEMEG